MADPHEPATSPEPAPEPAEREPLARRDRLHRGRRAAHLLRQGAIVAVLVAVVLGIRAWLPHLDAPPAATHAVGPQAPLPVGVVTVQPRTIPLASRFLAQTTASQTVPIRALVSGFLVERAFDEGQEVSAGQVLFRIDPQSFEVALQQARAQLEAAEARLQQAERQVARFRALAEVQSAAASELERAQETQQVAAAEVSLQRARIEQTRLDLQYATITSPIDGVVGAAEQDVGSYISPATNPLLATVRAVDPIEVRFSVSERALVRWQRLVRTGAVDDVPLKDFVVTVVLPDGREHPHPGRIEFVDVAVDPSTGTAVVHAEVPNPGRVLLPGQFVNVVVTGAHRNDTILVPQTAVVQSPAGAIVHVVDADGVVQVRPITAGDWHGTEWIVEAGLAAGDTVIVDRLMQVRPGMRVVPDPVR